jgi:phosphoribosyl 1,2-cyclic phosphodiesterase
VDAGKSARSLCLSLKAIGSDISEISAIFMTHEHTDHVSALETLSKKHHIPIHAAKRCADHLASRCPAASSCVVSHPPVFSVELDGITVSSFLTSHDSLCPVGYKIVSDSGESCGVATDTGSVTGSTADALKGCHSVVLECNHDRQMLAFGPYPPHLKERIASAVGHLSNDDCARMVSYLAENGTSRFILAHLSEENNTKELALSTVRRAVPGEGIVVSVSDPDQPVFM